MYIKRSAAESIKKSARTFPVVAILGPRQSGKTTLAKEIFADYTYVNLEDFDKRTFAEKDPRAFFETYAQGGLIIDEFQLVPQLLSYIQTRVDEHKRFGEFILTGSQNFLMNQAITQSLAGRIAIHTLLPLSIDELKQAGLLPDSAYTVLYKGLYPPIYVREELSTEQWYANYITTYIERDVRQLTNVSDLGLFQTFMQMVAVRIGQPVNLSSLANDCGISDVTARRWLNILDASYIIFLLKPHHKNFNKRLTKTPKIFFYDPGIACSLLNLKRTEIPLHYTRGGLFESLMIADIAKGYYNRALVPHLYFWQTVKGHEIDCVLDEGLRLVPIEIKSGQTIQSGFFDNLTYWKENTDVPGNTYLVYAGKENQIRTAAQVISWENIDTIVQKEGTRE
jgi:predicted AAA+ superfamily ATPase